MENPNICGHFGFMQIKTLKLRHMKPCADKSILGNNSLDFQCILNKSILKYTHGDLFFTRSRIKH